jgi:hypothetical protein
MERFKTDLEKELWSKLYSSQLALAKKLLEQRNKELRENGEPNTWPAQQEWCDMVGSSRAIFFRNARELAGIDHDSYLHILRNNIDAMEIAGNILEKECT